VGRWLAGSRNRGDFAPGLALLIHQPTVGGCREARAPKGYASYRAAFSLITVSQQFTEVSTWMLADVLAHELRHAADDAAGLWQANTPENCFGAEQSAYSTERRFLFWLSHTMHPEGLPNRYDLLAVVSPGSRARVEPLRDRHNRQHHRPRPPRLPRNLPVRRVCWEWVEARSPRCITAEPDRTAPRGERALGGFELDLKSEGMHVFQARSWIRSSAGSAGSSNRS
jgi:hypothetical protein